MSLQFARLPKLVQERFRSIDLSRIWQKTPADLSTEERSSFAAGIRDLETGELMPKEEKELREWSRGLLGRNIRYHPDMDFTDKDEHLNLTDEEAKKLNAEYDLFWAVPGLNVDKIVSEEYERFYKQKR